ncbi:DUF1080 domain-containing protein [bacterium]|nr:DUF1080 domain-containing protein [bacterium]
MDSRELIILVLVSVFGQGFAGELDPSQKSWILKYSKQENAPKPSEMLLNTDKEPELEEGFVSLLNGKDLSNWERKGGMSTFEYKNGMIVGTCVPGEPSTYLSTKRIDYSDFVFTCEMRWENDLNSGVMFRAKSERKRAVYGPQVEMEGVKNTRGWSGGIYGQSCGGYWYPLWLKEHSEARGALNKEGWNRVTVMAKGQIVKTWVNGIPTAHWKGDGTYGSGYFALQVHKAKSGMIVWRNLKVKELDQEEARLQELDLYWTEVSRAVGEGDFKGYAATCHPAGVLVSGKRERSYPLASALKRWKKEFDATKSGEMKASVDFRFKQRWGDDSTAHETGVFRYASHMKGGEKTVAYIELEALLVKKDGSWKVLMEFQKDEKTKGDWDKLE